MSEHKDLIRRHNMRVNAKATERMIGGLGICLGALWAWMAPGSWFPLVFGVAYVVFGFVRGVIEMRID